MHIINPGIIGRLFEIAPFSVGCKNSFRSDRLSCARVINPDQMYRLNRFEMPDAAGQVQEIIISG